MPVDKGASGRSDDLVRVDHDGRETGHHEAPSHEPPPCEAVNITPIVENAAINGAAAAVGAAKSGVNAAITAAVVAATATVLTGVNSEIDRIAHCPPSRGGGRNATPPLEPPEKDEKETAPTATPTATAAPIATALGASMATAVFPSSGSAAAEVTTYPAASASIKKGYNIG